jgi:hypothetical protein
MNVKDEAGPAALYEGSEFRLVGTIVSKVRIGPRPLDHADGRCPDASVEPLGQRGSVFVLLMIVIRIARSEASRPVGCGNDYGTLAFVDPKSDGRPWKGRLITDVLLLEID